MHNQRYKLNPLFRLVAVLFFLGFASALVAQAQRSVPRRPLHLQNKNDATNTLADAWQQARQMKYDPNAWPGAALPKTGGPGPLVATLNTNNWEWLGPGNIGGRTRSIVIHPTQPGTMWVGGVGGGVWKTTNNAASFFPCDDWMGNLAVSCLALDQTNPSVLYAGTGEGFGNADSITGAGVFKSFDGGSNWMQLNNFLLNSYNINRLVISPTNNKVILAATSAGIARSTDAGTNWNSTFLSGSVLDIAFGPTNGMQCVAAGKNLAGGLALYSTNGGTTWTAAAGVATTGRVELAYAPSAPNIVYASQDTNGGTLWISTDGGASYTLRNTGSNYLGAQGYYANCIWVDPTSSSNLVVGGLDLWRSTDGGATLTKISDWIANENNNAMVSVHADHHAIVSAPGFDGVANTTVYFGNDGGLYCATNIYTVTTNAGWLNLNHNLGITQPYGIAANPTTFTTILGNQDNGSTQWTPANGTSWTTWSGGDGGFCAADPTDPNYFYGEYVYLQIYRSTNATLSQTYIYGGIGEAGVAAGYELDDPDAPHSASFIAPFVLDPNNPNTMLAGGSNLWRSVNVKAPTPSWTCITTNNPNPRLDLSFISAIAVTPGNSDIIWIGYNDGVVYQTTNGTGARPIWTRKSPGSVNACTGLAVDPNNANTVYACFSGFGPNNFYRTTDGGTNWTNLSSGLPAAPLHSVVVAPFNSSYVYVGSDLGVFGSADQGLTWSPANEGPANVQVLNLAWARNYLLAATHGRGAYRIALGPPTIVLTPASVTNYVGSSATFSPSVVGQPALGFQWTYNGRNLAGANSPTLTLTNLQTTNSGTYTLWASNSFGSGSGAITLTVVEPPPYYGQAAGAGPVAYWRLNETAGATAYDSVGGYNGTNRGSLVLGVKGPTPPVFPGFDSSNTAYQFDGTTASVAVPALNLNTNTVTITAWVNLNGAQGHSPGIFSWQGAGNAGGQFLFGDSNNTLSAYWNGNLLTSTLLVPTNQWTFVALVVSPTNTVIYMATNSTLASWTSSGANAAAAFDSASYIGASPSDHFRGGIDEVTIYNHLLTPTQVANQLASAQTLLPAVTLTAPANGGSFVALSNILLTASVTTNGHSIGKVQFYNSSSLVGESTTQPYQATLSGATAGPLTFVAQAIYDGANVVSSLPVNITVTNLPPTPGNDITNTTPSTPVTIAVLANDTDPYNLPLTIQSVNHPGRGTAVIAGTNVMYTPFDYWFGVDAFNYTVNDGFGAAASASVTVTTPFPNFTSTYTNAVLNLGPVAYWRLNETSGTTAFDSARAHNGTNNGSLVLGTSGPTAPAFPGFEAANTAYQFDGADTSISFPALNLNSSNLTITAWLKSGGSQGTNSGIVSWGGTNSFWFGFGSYTFNNNTLNYERDGFSYGSSLTVPSNQWTFVALVVGVPTNNGAFYLATNSTLASYPISLYYFFTPPIIFTNTAFLGNNTGHYFNGAMDEVAVFNKTLTAAQIGGLLAAALTGVPSVALTAPTNGSSFNAASNILLSASVTTNGNHTISKVQFYNTNATLLGEALTPPYKYSWAGMPAGNYSILARAIYDGLESVDSAAVSVTVTNSGTVTATVGGLTNPGGDPVTISFSGTPGHIFDVQRSTNLLSWTTILTTNAPASGLFICSDNFSDLSGPPAYAFYRLSWAP
ncbi:MAG TPA: LamG-like jellyroll fold domain-containing protein [Candidatus Acidoferrum sp.]|nr:LamG-like jellyroll fold domain-containing protein [Candidatus Acidoferrum sp.]